MKSLLAILAFVSAPAFAWNVVPPVYTEPQPVQPSTYSQDYNRGYMDAYLTAHGDSQNNGYGNAYNQGQHDAYRQVNRSRY